MVRGFEEYQSIPVGGDMSKKKLHNLAKELYMLACKAQTLEAKILEVREQAEAKEAEIREMTWHLEGKEEFLELGDLILRISGSQDYQVYTKDQYEKA
jgi:hypothetical protein